MVSVSESDSCVCFCLCVFVCGELRCAVWNWSRRWRRIRSSLRHCRLSPQSTTNLSNPSSRDLHHGVPSARMSSTTPFLVSWQVIKHAGDFVASSYSRSMLFHPPIGHWSTFSCQWMLSVCLPLLEPQVVLLKMNMLWKSPACSTNIKNIYQ